MESSFFESKSGQVLGAGTVAFLFGTGFAFLMGDGLLDAAIFGIAMGIGFAIGVYLFVGDQFRLSGD